MRKVAEALKIVSDYCKNQTSCDSCGLCSTCEFNQWECPSDWCIPSEEEE